MIERMIDSDKRKAAAAAFKTILGLFDNPSREGLSNTPERFIKFLEEFLDPPHFKFTTFERENVDEMVLVDNIPFYSLCEHHIAPFFGVAHIAYIPNKRLVGLSKIPRCLDHYARNFQNQERITTQVAEKLQEELEPKGVAVVLRAQHLCMAMRGVKKHDVWTTTSKMTGVFRDEGMARNEFLNLIRR